MIPTILRYKEIGTRGYFLIQVVGGGQVENRIQIYDMLPEGRTYYLRGESWSDIDAALEQYDAIVGNAEREELALTQQTEAPLSEAEESEIWQQMHYGR